MMPCPGLSPPYVERLRGRRARFPEQYRPPAGTSALQYATDRLQLIGTQAQLPTARCKPRARLPSRIRWPPATGTSACRRGCSGPRLSSACVGLWRRGAGGHAARTAAGLWIQVGRGTVARRRCRRQYAIVSTRTLGCLEAHGDSFTVSVPEDRDEGHSRRDVGAPRAGSG